MDLIPIERSKFDGMNDKLVVDGANGVGGAKLKVLQKSLNVLQIEVGNSEDEGVLNDEVGADYVQKEKIVPRGFGSKDAGIRCASLDGDVDRFVYFSVLPESNGKIDLVDGDKILSLFALFIRDQLSFLNEKEDIKNCHHTRIGIYFEANCHGTVLFSESFIGWLEARSNELSSGSKGSEAEKAALRLLAVSKLINQAVGDALSGCSWWKSYYSTWDGR